MYIYIYIVPWLTVVPPALHAWSVTCAVALGGETDYSSIKQNIYVYISTIICIFICICIYIYIYTPSRHAYLHIFKCTNMYAYISTDICTHLS